MKSTRSNVWDKLSECKTFTAQFFNFGTACNPSNLFIGISQQYFNTSANNILAFLFSTTFFLLLENPKMLSAMSLTVALTMKTNTPVFSIGFQYIRQLAKFGWKEAISYPKVANLSVQKRCIQDSPQFFWVINIFYRMK